MNTYFIIALIFGMTIAFYLVGYQPLLFSAMSKYCASAETCSIDSGFVSYLFNSLVAYIFDWQNALTLILAFSTLALLGGLNLIAIVPFALAFILLDLVIFPTGVILESGLPAPIPLLILMFFKLASVLAIISFIRTG